MVILLPDHDIFGHYIWKATTPEASNRETPNLELKVRKHVWLYPSSKYKYTLLYQLNIQNMSRQLNGTTLQIA